MSQSKLRRLTDKIDSGEPLLGAMCFSNSVEMIDLMAHVGFDFVYIDQMFSSIGWSDLSNMIRAAQGSDMAVFPRIETDPWYSADDPGVASRVSRALALGADGVKVNVYSVNEARWAVEAGTGWHRHPHLVKFSSDDHEAGTQAKFKDHEDKAAASTLIIPSVESKLGIEQIDQMLDIPGIRSFGIAMTDAAIQLGHPMDYEHPDVWRLVDRAAAKAKERGIYLSAGTGYQYKTWDAIAGRVKRLHDRGIGIIHMQTPEYLFQLASLELLKTVKQTLRR